MSDETKICTMCAETINLRAKVCPRCRQAQRFWSVHNPLPWLLVLPGCFLALCAILIVRLDRLSNPSPEFAAFRDQLAVIESKMGRQQGEKERVVFIVGVITNRSEVCWKRLEFDCRFFDANGSLIDGKAVVGSFEILGHQEHVFRVDVKALRPLEDYASHKIVVKAATNARAWP